MTSPGFSIEPAVLSAAECDALLAELAGNPRTRAGANWLIPWHQDTALTLAVQFHDLEWGPWSSKAGVAYAHGPAWALDRAVALRVRLDESSSANSPLRVIPGSHRSGVLRDDQVLACVRNNEPVDCLTPRGGVVAMRPLLIHSSPKAQTAEPRRVLHIEYADALDLAPGIRLAVV
jgi:ectoine hydroxylase-related dioxygenase (phytanoyl-CoA dioxygenase family)